MNKTGLLIVLVVTGTGLIKPAFGQYISGKLSEETSVSILTVGPADPAYTTFGHTAIRLQDPANHIDRVYNYGTFDFDTPDFYLKFLYGDLDYYLSVEHFEQFKQANVALGRSIVSQTLDLSPTQLNALVKTLEQNSLPKHRSYQYRFFGQNCVTQVRDLLSDQNIWSSSGPIEASVLSAPTYRQKLGVYLTNRPWMQLGVNLMLGAKVDQLLTSREQNFLPNALHFSLANASDASGERLIESSETIAKAAMPKPKPTISPTFVLWTVFLIVTVFTAASLMLHWQGWWIDRVLFGVVGLLGIIMAFGAFLSLHEPLHHNWNLLWALPTHLLVVIGMPPSLNQKWIQTYFLVTLALGSILMIGWAFIPQQIPHAVIPVIGAIMIRSAYRLYMATRSEGGSYNTRTNSVLF